VHGERIWYMETYSGSFVQFTCCPALLFQRDLLFIQNFVGSGHSEESSSMQDLGINFWLAS
jgi:hypothetical protein